MCSNRNGFTPIDKTRNVPTMSLMTKGTIGILELSRRTGHNRKTLQRWIKSGETPPALVGASSIGRGRGKGYRFILGGPLDEWVDRHAKPNKNFFYWLGQIAGRGISGKIVAHGKWLSDLKSRKDLIAKLRAASRNLNNAALGLKLQR